MAPLHDLESRTDPLWGSVARFTTEEEWIQDELGVRA
jgi:hypothetical protein